MLQNLSSHESLQRLLSICSTHDQFVESTQHTHQAQDQPNAEVFIVEFRVDTESQTEQNRTVTLPYIIRLCRTSDIHSMNMGDTPSMVILHKLYNQNGIVGAHLLLCNSLQLLTAANHTFCVYWHKWLCTLLFILAGYGACFCHCPAQLASATSTSMPNT